MEKIKAPASLFRSINHYHNAFYSFNKATKARPILVIASFMFFCGFILFLIPALGGASLIYPSSNLEQDHYLFFALVFEVLVLLCSFWLKEIRDKEAIETLKSYGYETKANDLNSFKCDWINRTFGVDREDYLSLANNIDQAMGLWEKNQLKLSFSKTQIGRVLFIDGTPTRIFNAILAIAAAVIALSIAGGATIDDIFDAIHEVKPNTLWTLFVLIPLLLYLAGFMLKYLILMAVTVAEISIAKLDGLNSRSENRAKVLIIDLLRFYRPPFGTVRPANDKGNLIEQ